MIPKNPRFGTDGPSAPPVMVAIFESIIVSKVMSASKATDMPQRRRAPHQKQRDARPASSTAHHSLSPSGYSTLTLGQIVLDRFKPASTAASRVRRSHRGP